MFNPQTPGSIGVPMFRVDWNWFGSATNGPPWGKLSGTATVGNKEPTEAFPSWTHTITIGSMNTSPEFMAHTNCFQEN
jgi:hypothetical protein